VAVAADAGCQGDLTISHVTAQRLNDVNRQHWRAFPGENGWKGAPVLDFFVRSPGSLDADTPQLYYGRAPHGITGTVEMLLAGAPSISLRLMAR